MNDPTAADHARMAEAMKSEALAYFHKRWDTLSNRAPRRGVWTTTGLGFGTESRLHFFHSLCRNARAHATMATRMLNHGLRTVPLIGV